MSRRQLTYRAKCGHEGCTEHATFDASSRAELMRLDRDVGYGRWRCVRHSQPNEVLSPTNLVRVWEDTSQQLPHGVFFTNAGFLFGPGFKVFAADFPPGTRLRVTAEIILPETL